MSVQKMSSHRAILSFWLLVFSPVVFLASSATRVQSAVDRSAEIKEFMAAVDSENRSTRLNALKKIVNSGLTDRSLFDLLDRKLRQSYQVDSQNQPIVDEISWLCKALASSGLPEYKATLKEVMERTSSAKIKNYAEQSLKLLDSYATRNATMAKETEETRGLSPEVAKLINMLRSKDLRLQKDAAKNLTRSNFQEIKLYDVVSEELLAGVQAGSYDTDRVDTLMWFCKALSASGKNQYKATLEKVLADTTNEKLKQSAKQSLDSLK